MTFARRIAVLTQLALLAANPLLLADEPTHTSDGFALPQRGHTFTFPRDHGSHPDFAIEWWYIVGHLFDEDGNHYGFQATFFRNASPPASQLPDLSSTYAGNQLFLAHMSFLDVSTGRHFDQERLNREGWDAYASTERLDIRNGNWTLRMADDSELMDLRGSMEDNASFHLSLDPAKPLTLFGDRGYSVKGSDVGAASYYLTYTRLMVDGTIELDGRTLPVTGQAWMDHEISSNQLADNQVGWDWTSVQLDDGRELMLYILRLEDGSPDPASKLAWVDDNSQTTHFGPDGFSWRYLDFWTSEETGATYPVKAEITTTDPATGEAFTFVLDPLNHAQEVLGNLGGIDYWEGACRVLDAEGNRIGWAYKELTGYSESLSGRL